MGLLEGQNCTLAKVCGLGVFRRKERLPVFHGPGCCNLLGLGVAARALQWGLAKASLGWCRPESVCGLPACVLETA